MVLSLMLIGLAVTLDPLPLSAFLVVLPSKRGVRKGAAFVFGWLVSLAIVVTVTVLATGNNPPRPNTVPTLASLAVWPARGTMWTTTDRCDGTLTRVQRGVVVVTNLRTRRQIVLRAGRSYLAKAP